MLDIGSMTKDELADFIRRHTQKDGTLPDMRQWPYTQARELRRRSYGDRVFLRGLIEFTSYCLMDCYYCGLRRSNAATVRYRLDMRQILDCCDMGHRLGFRTFVLQGGEDGAWDDRGLCALVSAIKNRWPDCAVTLSVGERSGSSYRALRDAGADRYLLRHETADPSHFQKLHPPPQVFESRKKCFWALREAGFQVGAGCMVGSPGQTAEHLAEDLLFLKELRPEMVGIGPFIPHRDTPFAREKRGSLSDTLLMLALVRILLPDVLLPATTALGSIHPQGRELGLTAGANVVMPNLSPTDVRKSYSLYNGKLSSGAEAAEGIAELRTRIESIGMRADFSRGDHIPQIRKDI